MKSNKEKNSKTTSEKPISLSPLNLKEALEGLLKVEPKEDKGEQKAKKPNNKGAEAWQRKKSRKQ